MPYSIVFFNKFIKKKKTEVENTHTHTQIEFKFYSFSFFERLARLKDEYFRTK